MLGVPLRVGLNTGLKGDSASDVSSSFSELHIAIGFVEFSSFLIAGVPTLFSMAAIQFQRGATVACKSGDPSGFTVTKYTSSGTRCSKPANHSSATSVYDINT